MSQLTKDHWEPPTPPPRAGRARRPAKVILESVFVHRETRAGAQAFRAFADAMRGRAERDCTEAMLGRALLRFSVRHRAAILKAFAEQHLSSEREVSEAEVIETLERAFQIKADAQPALPLT